MKKIIIFMIISVCSLGLGIGIMNSSPEVEKKLESAISITDGKLDKANEGKLVVVSGKLDADLPIVDPVTDVTIPYIKARRIVHEFRHIPGTDYEYEWDTVGEDYSDENNGGVNGDYNVSGMIIANCRIGDIEIDPPLLKQLNAGTNWKNISQKHLGKYPFKIGKDKISEEVYLSENGFHPEFNAEYDSFMYKENVGDICYNYTIVDENDPLEYTILGIQRGNGIVEDKDIDCLPLMEGIHDAKDFKESTISSYSKMYIGLLIAGFVFLVLGIRAIISRKKEKDL